MIQGFRHETSPLTEYELNIVTPLIASIIRACVGKENAKTNAMIRKELEPFSSLSQARVRKIINHIRTTDIVPRLVASSRGYYITDSCNELAEYEESLLGREMAIRNVRASIERQRMDLIAGTTYVKL